MKIQHTVLLKSGQKMFVWSVNTDDKTMHGYPVEKYFEYTADPSFMKLEKWDVVDVVWDSEK